MSFGTRGEGRTVKDLVLGRASVSKIVYDSNRRQVIAEGKDVEAPFSPRKNSNSNSNKNNEEEIQQPAVSSIKKSKKQVSKER